ncbi:hypothetical protein O0I10_009622 [Lichtheimia ornata]|uniref:Uncharacterized protein n=1 Tax=Lichtheimia ornata TaxID=688661 RepID=A0AAD7UZ38_9FUNG|nr:uncharacterized protein O0I10_009622 [Lichtheimia ornata]KAJ8654731.1 hypothetical protein O0I10_009622 [Lichtheimia ornata]
MLDHLINHDSTSHAHSYINKAVVTNTVIRPFFLLVLISSLRAFRDKGTCHITLERNRQGRQDVILSWLRGGHFAKNIGFAKVKRIEERANSSKFSKSAVENREAKACISIQSVGRTSTFYMTKLVADYLYVIIEIGTEQSRMYFKTYCVGVTRHRYAS